MIGYSKLIKVITRHYMMDIGRGKSPTSKHRHQRSIRVRIRRFIKNEFSDQNHSNKKLNY